MVGSTAGAGAGAGTSAGAGGAAGPAGLLGIYAELSKSRLSSLVVLTTGAGHLLAPGIMDMPTLGATLAGTFLCAASANSFNQLIEIKPDATMQRTANRPLPSGRISPAHATAFAGCTGAAGVSTLLACTNPTTAALGAGTIALYTLVYTPLKRRAPINTWVGAVVGALPPVMGWTAAGGALLSPEAAALSGVLFLWQIPHFLALAWMYRADYAKGGYHMLPLTDPTGAKTAAVCLEYSVYLTLLPFCCWATGLTSCMFTVESAVFNGAMLFAAWRFAEDPRRGHAHARRLFLASLAYLPAFFFCFLLHHRQSQPAADTASAALADTGDGFLCSLDSALDDALERIRRRGRELCVHEQLVHPEDTPALKPTPTAALCPVAAADALAQSAQAAISAPRQSQHHQQQN